MNIREELARYRLVPVISLNDAKDAAPLGEALVNGGLPVAEVSFRADTAEETIRVLAHRFPEIVLGARGLATLEQARRALASGAQFLVTAGFSPRIVEYCLSAHIPVFPGVCTPSELLWLLNYELSVAEFFPAEQFGGLATVKALGEPYPDIKFLPTGGVSAKNAAAYLACPKVLACGVSWMTEDSLIAAGKFDEIEKLAAKAVSLAG